MMDEFEGQEDLTEEHEQKTFNMKGVAKALAILFVFAIYILIFLKVLVLK